MRTNATSLFALLAALSAATAYAASSQDVPPTLPYCVVGTGQNHVFSNTGQLLKAPKSGEPFFGQDACYRTCLPSYRNNNDGTVSDLNTGLAWVQARGRKVTWQAALAGAKTCRVGGYSDWRMPTIKELYSLINFNGGCRMTEADSTPYLDRHYFGFQYGDVANGERLIDCQDWSATAYVSTTMRNDATIFGVNFADGRIKGYPKINPGPSGTPHTLFVRYVRGNPHYGKNDFHDNDDGTISDQATGLMWTQKDSGRGMDWEHALAWVQAKNAAKYLGHGDWRLPNAKELQSIVDYTRSPATTHSPAIDPRFKTTRLANGEYPYFWSGTTHLDGPIQRQGMAAVYVAFGRGTGWMRMPPWSTTYALLDVHGADASAAIRRAATPPLFPHGRGPQGDVIGINNFVRAVRNIDPQMVRLAKPDVTPLPHAAFSAGGAGGFPPQGRRGAWQGPPAGFGPPPPGAPGTPDPGP